MSELLRSQQQVLVVGLEPTYGAGETLTGADAVLVQDLDVQMIEAQTSDRNNITGYMGAQGAVTTQRKITASFGVELAGSGTPATPPKWGTILLGCGFAEVVGASDVAYTPVGESFSSLAMLYRIGKVQQRLNGSRGKVVINLDQGTIPSLKFNTESLYEDPTVEVAALSGIDLSAFKTPVGVTDVATEVSFLGSPVKMKKLSIDPGIEVAFEAHTEGESVEIGNRKGSVSLSFRTDEQELVTMIQNGSNNVEGALVATHGLTAGNILTIDVPNVQIKTAKVSWDGDFANIDVVADIRPLSANTDLSITQS